MNLNEFMNMYPWYDWVAVIIVMAFILSVIWIVNHNYITPAEPEQVLDSFDSGEAR